MRLYLLRVEAEFIREVDPGEMIVVDGKGLRSLRPFESAPEHFCVFEHIYFARPDSRVEGIGVYDARKRIGMELAREAGVEADLVVAVPDSGVPAALGYSMQSGIPFERPKEYEGRTLDSFTPEELAKLTKQRQEQTIERNPTLSEFPGATSPMHWFEFYNAANSHAWLVSDPPDGHVPAQTAEADARGAARAALRAQHGPAEHLLQPHLAARQPHR